MHHKRLCDHVLNNFAGSIVTSGGFTGSNGSLGIIRSQKIFEHLAEQFRVEGYFLINRRVFIGSEIVAFEYWNKATHSSVITAPEESR
ncbi:MAG: hypothetical protein BWY69_01477 [Planctomycetes bacterium ADurb.Bin401]|nr:MAG: hypothetical protein BWY69_01477 [Planctomycetes bacterium ADurb.Bin401]